MSKKLLIVESPAKSKTIQKYLGPDFSIMASVGHVKDLPVNKLGVDIENNFMPEYVTIKGKTKVLKALKAAAKKADSVYLAPDPDREGEAIAWHIAQELENGKQPVFRVLFNEITAKAVRAAVASPQELDSNKFEAQQARRILDRLVGYQISPLLWTRVKRGLSAGRVQSVAVKMICDREREIFAFEPREYWTLTAHLEAGEPPRCEARFAKYDGKKIELVSGKQTRGIISEIEGLDFEVARVSKKKKKKNPLPPFTTSLLQQDAFRKLRFSPKKTMAVAQGLYEGIELGKMGQNGLITYMRTDSFRISNDAVSQARDYILDVYGQDYLPNKPNYFRSKKGAQEAHEAIRPTSMEFDPGTVSKYLNKDQLALYALIWTRFTASQMSPAIMDQTQAEITVGKTMFRASGSIVTFKGFMILYKGAPNKTGDKSGLLPPLKKGEILNLHKLDPVQHFTQPPPRYTAASLIKALEENGIGRPSTYAAILANISGREYVTTEKMNFKPTELGFLVTDLLTKNFPAILDTDFTAQMENELDKVERASLKWTNTLTQFYKSFQSDLKKAEKGMKGEITTNIVCPQCSKIMSIKSGRNGLFLACSGYPDCKSTSNFLRNEKGEIVFEKTPDVPEKQGVCEKCGKPMVIKNGKFGPFLACSGYPDCKNTLPLDVKSKGQSSTNVACPEEGCSGTIIEKTSKKGRTFYACNRYPDCRFAMWDEPANGTCPECNTKVFAVKRRKRTEDVIVCRKKGCGYTRHLNANEES